MLFRSKEEEKKEKYHWIDKFNHPPYENIEKVYQNYKNAMDRKRPDSSLDFDRFQNHILNNDQTKTFKYGNSYAFGNYENGIFFPSHFSPNTLKEGAELFKQLKKQRVVLFVTSDLSKMAEKIGFIKVYSGYQTEFRDQSISKDILISNMSIKDELMDMIKNYEN